MTVGKVLGTAMLAGLATLVTALVLAGALQPRVAGAAGDESETELAKKTQNPVSDLISVPFQSNFYFNAGAKEQAIYVLNVQPVVPIRLTEDWNLITRTIIPIINQPSLFPRMESAFGLGDINPTLFLSPAKPGALVWGVGPTFTLPTASEDLLGSGKWSAGPAAVALLMQGPWVVGALANQQWSFADSGGGHKHVSQLLIQPFVNYNLPQGWYLTSSPIITANWEAESKNHWTVPVGGGVGKLLKLGPLPVNVNLAAFANVARPSWAPDWQLRFQIQFLFPK